MSKINKYLYYISIIFSSLVFSIKNHYCMSNNVYTSESNNNSLYPNIICTPAIDNNAPIANTSQEKDLNFLTPNRSNTPSFSNLSNLHSCDGLRINKHHRDLNNIAQDQIVLFNIGIPDSQKTMNQNLDNDDRFIASKSINILINTPKDINLQDRAKKYFSSFAETTRRSAVFSSLADNTKQTAVFNGKDYSSLADNTKQTAVFNGQYLTLTPAKQQTLVSRAGSSSLTHSNEQTAIFNGQYLTLTPAKQQTLVSRAKGSSSLTNSNEQTTVFNRKHFSSLTATKKRSSVHHGRDFSFLTPNTQQSAIFSANYPYGNMINQNNVVVGSALTSHSNLNLLSKNITRQNSKSSTNETNLSHTNTRKSHSLGKYSNLMNHGIVQPHLSKITNNNICSKPTTKKVQFSQQPIQSNKTNMYNIHNRPENTGPYFQQLKEPLIAHDQILHSIKQKNRLYHRKYRQPSFINLKLHFDKIGANINITYNEIFNKSRKIVEQDVQNLYESIQCFYITMADLKDRNDGIGHIIREAIDSFSSLNETIYKLNYWPNNNPINHKTIKSRRDMDYKHFCHLIACQLKYLLPLPEKLIKRIEILMKKDETFTKDIDNLYVEWNDVKYHIAKPQYSEANIEKIKIISTKKAYNYLQHITAFKVYSVSYHQSYLVNELEKLENNLNKIIKHISGWHCNSNRQY